MWLRNDDTFVWFELIDIYIHQPKKILWEESLSLNLFYKHENIYFCQTIKI